MKIKDGEQTMTLAELGLAICNSMPCGSCYDGSCPAAKYCRKGHNGAQDWLREVIKNENE